MEQMVQSRKRWVGGGASVAWMSRRRTLFKMISRAETTFIHLAEGLRGCRSGQRLAFALVLIGA